MALNSYKISDTLHHSRRFLLYKAERISDGKRVLIKTQDPGQITDKNLADSLISEAETAIKLSHPSLRKGLGCFQEGLGVYLVAEFAEGESLAERILHAPPQLNQALEWAKELLSGLIYLEQSGEFHENLNPYNIIIAPDNSLKLIGCGKKRSAWKHSEGNFKYQLPMLYVAPEIFTTGNTRTNSHLYSWAVVVYQTICGNLPWRLDSFSSPEEQKHQSFSRAVSMPGSDLMPDWLYGVLLGCLKLDPLDRPANATELLDMLIRESPDFDWKLAQAPLDESEVSPCEEVELEEPITMELAPPVEEEAEVSPLSAIETLEPAVSEQQETVTISPFDAPEPDPDLVAEILLKTELEPPSESGEAYSLTSQDPEPVLQEEQGSEAESVTQKTEETSELVDYPEPVFDIPEDSLVDSAILDDSIGTAQLEKEPDIVPALPDISPEIPKEVPQEKPAPQWIPEPKVTSETQPDPKLKSRWEQPTPYQSPKPEPKDLSGMQKVFRVFLVLSILIVIYIAVQQFVLRDRPDFDIPEPEVDTEEIVGNRLKDNSPIDMVLVPADTLIMGSISPEASEDEFPLLTVPVNKFMISTREITQGEWLMVFENNPSLFRGDELPVENVSFYDVIEFCNAKSLKDGLTPVYDYYGTEIVCDFTANGYRLPTEAEWELAAKEGKGKNLYRYSGADDADQVAWYAENSNARTHQAGGKRANALGIYDMSGNLYEWVWNWYTPYSHRITDLFAGPESGTDKVIRGGSWYHNENLLRNTSRNYVKPFVKNSYIGFRVVRSY